MGDLVYSKQNRRNKRLAFIRVPRRFFKPTRLSFTEWPTQCQSPDIPCGMFNLFALNFCLQENSLLLIFVDGPILLYCVGPIRFATADPVLLERLAAQTDNRLKSASFPK